MDQALEDSVLANAPEFVGSMAEADAEIAQGERGVPLEVFLGELDNDDGGIHTP